MATTMSPPTNNYTSSNADPLIIIPGIFYSISFLLGLISNTLVLLVILTFKRFVAASNFFIFILAICDLTIVILCIPTTYTTAFLLHYWPLSSFMCVFLNFTQSVVVTLTVYTLILITIEKYDALCHPFKNRMSRKCSKICFLAITIFALVVSLPIGIFTELQIINTQKTQNESLNTNSYSSGSPQCTENWPKSLAGYLQIYNFLVLIIQYLMPVVILIFCYVRIGCLMYYTKAPGEVIKSRDEKMLESRKRVRIRFYTLLLV